MEKDIVPALLELIEKEFDQKILNSSKVKQALKLLQKKKATYINANDFAIEVGEILASVLGKNITAEILPDGKMYYNIADRILNPTMNKNYELISNYAADMQTELNHNAGFNIKGQKAKLNQDRIDGIVNRVSSEDNFDDIKWILDDPIVNFSQSVVDDTVKENVEFAYKAGIKAKIIRRAESKACKWCRNLAGTYNYPDDVPEDVYKRHENCRCTVEYLPGDGRKQNVHSKKWAVPEEQAKREARKVVGLKVGDTRITKLSTHVHDQMEIRSVVIEEIQDAIEKPLDIGPVKTDNAGRPSFKVVGEKATIYVNPKSGIMTTVHPTHTKTAKKLKERK